MAPPLPLPHHRLLFVLLVASSAVLCDDTNHACSSCGDTIVQRSDGFALGIAFSSRTTFFYNGNSSVRLSPCDARLALSSSSSAARLTAFWPKVDEISLLTVNASAFSLGSYQISSLWWNLSSHVLTN